MAGYRENVTFTLRIYNKCFVNQDITVFISTFWFVVVGSDAGFQQ
jgi:hypothetical protein